jgi:nucleoside-diphosphate-sugar epimerase
MRVFITGANGYIGSAVAAAMARAGHRVYGLVRSEEKAKALRAQEVLPVIGSLQDDTVLRDAAKSCEVLVHCAVDYASQWQTDMGAIHTLLGAASGAGRARLFIYTSGVWVYGDTGARATYESCAVNPLPFSKPRLESECRALTDAKGKVRSLVLRPGCVYGGKGGLTASWFSSAASKGAASMVGDGNCRWAMVHVADLADAYVRAAESQFTGMVFNVTDHSRFTVRDCAEAASIAAGAGGKVESVPVERAVKEMGEWAEALTFNQNIDSSMTSRALGWQPKHGGFVDGAARYYESWKASQNE